MIHLRHILITAGPTIEPIDPVRFVSNRSTGRMGCELAQSAKKRKYKVTLISGPLLVNPPKGIKHIRVETARELKKIVHKELKKADALVMASAVSDFRPAFYSKNKIKSGKNITLKLEKNPDILASVSKRERKNKLLVGFALETGNLLRNARNKLKEKNLDLIVANKCGKNNDPFGSGPKTVYILGRRGLRKVLKKSAKKRIAGAILDTLNELCYTPN